MTRDSPKEKALYGTARIAAECGVTENTIRNWRRSGLCDWTVESCSNAGGGLGRALMTMPTTARFVKARVEAMTSSTRAEIGRAGAFKRWRVIGPPMEPGEDED